MVFNKLKRLAGIGTLDVVVLGPDTVDLSTGTLTATIQVTAKSDCDVKDVEVTFVHEYTDHDERDGRDVETQRTRTLGRTKLPGFQIAEGDSTTVTVDVGFTPKNVGILDDKLREKGGMLGRIGELGLLSGASGTYEVKAVFDVVGAANDPDDSRTVRVQ
ncbi:hypothetical protein [Jatrophihabitans fulvus]